MTAKIKLHPLISLLILSIMTCSTVYLGDWIYAEITYQKWLAENELRVNLSTYKTSREAGQVKETVLEKIPIGTPEEKLIAFYLANVEGASRQYWQVTERSLSYCPNGQECGFERFPILVDRKGHWFQRKILCYQWDVFLYLDLNTHKLLDIEVSYFLRCLAFGGNVNYYL